MKRIRRLMPPKKRASDAPEPPRKIRARRHARELVPIMREKERARKMAEAEKLRNETDAYVTLILSIADKMSETIDAILDDPPESNGITTHWRAEIPFDHATFPANKYDLLYMAIKEQYTKMGYAIVVFPGAPGSNTLRATVEISNEVLRACLAPPADSPRAT